MSDQTIVGAIILGLVEGATEFLPVSSTAHLLLLGDIIGFDSTGKAFEILIQLGAILAIVSVYFHRLWKLAVTLPYDTRSRIFAGGVLLAFLPSAALGATFHSFIKTVLFETPTLICIMLIVGGIILLTIDNLSLTAKYRSVTDYPLSLCFKIGLFQCLALIPGVSRSGATIVGSLLMGADKRSAAEFSFFLAIPTMAGAFAYDFYKNANILNSNDLQYIGVGFIAAFLSALIVVNNFLNFISRHGFSIFGWWRIALGCLTLIWLYLT